MSEIDDTWKEFLESYPRESDLHDILAKNNEYFHLAAKTLYEKGLLFEKDLTNKELCKIISYSGSEPLKEEVGRKLLAQGPSNRDLRYIIAHVESLRAEAWEKLLEQKPDNDDLVYIIRYSEPFREEAW